MHDLFAALLRQPTTRRYKQLRSQLLADSSLGNLSLCLAEIEDCITNGELHHASDLVADLLPAGLLSLRLHRLGGELALTRGDQQRAELHRFTYHGLKTAILATGDGTRRRPLLITYASDATELLTALGNEVLSQSLVEEKERRFDVLLCSGEREFWFDVTDLLPQTAVVAVRSRQPKAGAAAKPSRRKRAVSRVGQGLP
jgi:hypothetical protein